MKVALQVITDVYKISLNSLRSFGASAAANEGIPDRLFKRHGRWASKNAKDCYRPFINGCQFKILLYAFKLASLNSFESKNSFELSTRLVRLILIITKEFIIGSHL